MRYTTFERLQYSTNVAQESRERVWLRDSSQWLTVEYEAGNFSYWIGDHYNCSEGMARDVFNLEMRVYGWVSTERTE